jgi:co-chaperonin GroES (HSP10)
MIRPLRDFITVKPAVRSLSSVIHVNNKEPFNEGEIVAVGPKVKEAQVGDWIKYGNGDYLNWPTHTFDGQDYQIIQEADVCTVVEGETA